MWRPAPLDMLFWEMLGTGQRRHWGVQEWLCICNGDGAGTRIKRRGHGVWSSRNFHCNRCDWQKRSTYESCTCYWAFFMAVRNKAKGSEGSCRDKMSTIEGYCLWPCMRAQSSWQVIFLAQERWPIFLTGKHDQLEGANLFKLHYLMTYFCALRQILYFGTFKRREGTNDLPWTLIWLIWRCV